MYLLQINSPVYKVPSRLREYVLLLSSVVVWADSGGHLPLSNCSTHTHTHMHSTHVLKYPAVLMAPTCSGICESHFSKPLDALGIVDGPILIQDS